MCSKSINNNTKSDDWSRNVKELVLLRRSKRLKSALLAGSFEAHLHDIECDKTKKSLNVQDKLLGDVNKKDESKNSMEIVPQGRRTRLKSLNFLNNFEKDLPTIENNCVILKSNTPEKINISRYKKQNKSNVREICKNSTCSQTQSEAEVSAESFDNSQKCAEVDKLNDSAIYTRRGQSENFDTFFNNILQPSANNVTDSLNDIEQHSLKDNQKLEFQDIRLTRSKFIKIVESSKGDLPTNKNNISKEDCSSKKTNKRKKTNPTKSHCNKFNEKNNNASNNDNLLLAPIVDTTSKKGCIGKKNNPEFNYRKVNLGKTPLRVKHTKQSKLTKVQIRKFPSKKIPRDRLESALDVLNNDDHPVWEERNTSCNPYIYHFWESASLMLSDQNVKIKYARQFLLRRDWFNLSRILCLSNPTAKTYYPLICKYAALLLAHTDKDKFNKFMLFLTHVTDSSSIMKTCTKISTET